MEIRVFLGFASNRRVLLKFPESEIRLIDLFATFVPLDQPVNERDSARSRITYGNPDGNQRETEKNDRRSQPYRDVRRGERECRETEQD